MSSTARTLLAALSLLLIGAAAGVGGDRLMQAHQHRPHVVNGRMVGDPLTLMDDELHLTPAQRTAIREIFTRRQPEVDAAWHAARAQVKTTVDSIIAEVAAQLEPRAAHALL